uniref:Uncharacterized protein n=1 Tax=Wuchereria bancrofti TaxID=6293 RepID=A0AAF5Q150_WUCBA
MDQSRSSTIDNRHGYSEQLVGEYKRCTTEDVLIGRLLRAICKLLPHFPDLFIGVIISFSHFRNKQKPLIDLTHGCTGTGTDTGTESLRSDCVVSGTNLNGKDGGDCLKSSIGANALGDSK